MFSPDRFGESSTNPPRQEQVKPLLVQEQANYKGNWWLTQLDRLNNPTIRKQLIDLWESNENYLQENGTKEYVGAGAELKDPKTGETVWLIEELGIPKHEEIYKTNPYKALTREEIESQIQEAIDREAAFTPIDFDETRSGSSNMPIGYRKNHVEPFSRNNIHHPSKRVSLIGVQEDEMIPNQNAERVMSLVEAHEKGHSFRTLHRSPYLGSLFDKGFDFPASDRYLDTWGPSELIERMAQLKNYFGMKGDEKFTPQHLEYARQHYLKDVGLDNNMEEFFQGITPEKEFAFLKLMNSIGI